MAKHAVLAAVAGVLIWPSTALADATVTADDGFAFGNPNPSVQVGEKVVWQFSNPGVAHNVAATGGNWSFRSGDFTVNHGTHEYTFTAPGSYSYVCELHAPSMSGTVTVLAPGQTPPPPGTPPPTAPPPGSPPPVPPPAAAPDTVDPRLTAVAVQRSRRAARVRFRLSETATVTLRLRGGATRTLRKQVKAGRRTVTLRGLRRGRYRIDLQARDASGNRSAWRHTSVRRAR